MWYCICQSKSHESNSGDFMSHVEYDVEYLVMKGSDILSELIVLDSVYMYMYLYNYYICKI